MTATSASGCRPAKTPLYTSHGGQIPLACTERLEETSNLAYRFGDSESIMNDTCSHWSLSRGYGLDSLSIDPRERSMLESAIKSEASLNSFPDVPRVDQQSSAYNSVVRPKGFLIFGLTFAMSYVFYVLASVRKAALFIARNQSLILSLSPVILNQSTFCSFGPISSTPLCSSTSKKSSEVNTAESANAVWADFTSLTEVQGSLADYFVGDVSGTGASELAIKIAKAELATSDLIVAVRYSTLRSAEQLADSLTLFVRDASEAGDNLQDLDAKVMGAIDKIVNYNVWALKGIQEAQAPSGVFSALSIWQSKKSIEEIVNDHFSEAMREQERILFDLITQAKASQARLKRLKETLQAIRDLAQRENIHINAQQGEILASMWTKLGSNRRDTSLYEKNLELLTSLEEYTDVAKTHVAQALINLKTMQAQMKDLREKVSRPDITGTNIPVDVHIKIIMDGILRMKEGRIRARERESDIRSIGAS